MYVNLIFLSWLQEGVFSLSSDSGFVTFFAKIPSTKHFMDFFFEISPPMVRIVARNIFFFQAITSDQRGLKLLPKHC